MIKGGDPALLHMERQAHALCDKRAEHLLHVRLVAAAIRHRRIDLEPDVWRPNPVRIEERPRRRLEDVREQRQERVDANVKLVAADLERRDWRARTGHERCELDAGDLELLLLRGTDRHCQDNNHADQETAHEAPFMSATGRSYRD
jgi:hypothetical protein